MTPWNATSGVVEPRTWVDYIKGNVTEVILYNIGNDKNLNTASMEQEVANFTIGSSYRIWLNERWSCMSLFDDAASAKGACRWEVLVDGKSVYSRLSNAGESRPDAKYPTRHRVTGPIVFNASEKSHDIAFKATRVAKDVGQAAWMINKVVLTGPW
ncbi:hypothetical protein KVT40_005940 [Elsinoe batatas]|uniref:Uncharacterized protein n=1 Tax=Elsinoe batatas TaxID=2601811 RepID=A0A8K0L3X8_9PEZI|nr:hypothetical protein KVT40_005940 [Elsinoe batatas]